MLRSGVRVLRRSDSEGAKDYCSASPAAKPSRLTRVFLSLQAHLAERLARGANWTVFAPNDVAFAATLEALGLSKASLLASKELLDVLVRLHIAPGKACTLFWLVYPFWLL